MYVLKKLLFFLILFFLHCARFNYEVIDPKNAALGRFRRLVQSLFHFLSLLLKDLTLWKEVFDVYHIFLLVNIRWKIHLFKSVLRALFRNFGNKLLCFAWFLDLDGFQILWNTCGSIRALFLLGTFIWPFKQWNIFIGFGPLIQYQISWITAFLKRLCFHLRN